MRTPYRSLGLPRTNRPASQTPIIIVAPEGPTPIGKDRKQTPSPRGIAAKLKLLRELIKKIQKSFRSFGARGSKRAVSDGVVDAGCRTM